MDWKTDETRLKQLERRLYELTREVKGMQPAQADRIADVVEQIDEVRQDLQRQGEELKQGLDKLDKVAEYVKKHVPRKNGEPKNE